MEIIKPKIKIRYGNISASVWDNERVVNGQKVIIESVSLQKVWKDKRDNFQNATINLDKKDFMKVIMCLQETYMKMNMESKS